MIVVFRLNDRYWKVWFVKEQIIGTFLLAACHHLASNDDSTIGKGVFATPTCLIPPRADKGGRNKTVTNI
jgi:hypothetical protein